MMKVGISEVGKKATASHTGSLAGSDSVFNAFCKQSGIIRVYDLEELFDVIYALSISRIPTGKRVGVITTSGGAGVSIADKASQLGLDIPTLREETRTELRNILPAFGSALNPVDVTGQISSRVIAKSQEAELYRKCVEIVARDPEIDVLLIMLTMTGQDRAPKMANDIVHISKHTDKPVLVSWLAGDLAKEGYRILNENFIPTFKTPERCVVALKKLVEYAEILNNAQKKKDLMPLTVNRSEELRSYLRTIKQSALTEFESRKVLEGYGIPLAKCIAANSSEEAIKGAEAIGFPVVLKIDSPDIMHKTEVGGIKLGIGDKVALAESYQELIDGVKSRVPKARIKGVLVEEMIHGQAEIIIGMSQDPQFGPTIMFGLGGIFVEIFKDISIRVAPISSTDAENMIKETKGYEILKGFRGKPRLDVESIIDILLRLSQLAIDFRDRILEIDLNPVILLEEGKGAKVVDSLIVLQNE
jgi:acetyltransferase